MTITRSHGYDTGFLGLRAGAGCKGATAELDAVVMAGAEALQAAFNRRVQVRFNTDRQSGGAFVAFESGEIGIRGERRVLARMRELNARWADESFETLCERVGVDPQGAEEQTIVSAYIARGMLRESGAEDTHSRCVNALDVADAMRIIREQASLVGSA